MSRTKGKFNIDARIQQLLHKQKTQKAELLSTSDEFRSGISTVQKSLYAVQVGLGAFKNLTNHHVPMQKRLFNVCLSIASVLLMEMLRNKTMQTEDTPEEAL